MISRTRPHHSISLPKLVWAAHSHYFHFRISRDFLAQPHVTLPIALIIADRDAAILVPVRVEMHDAHLPSPHSTSMGLILPLISVLASLLIRAERTWYQ